MVLQQNPFSLFPPIAVDAKEAVRPLLSRFPDLVRWTWPKGDNEQLLHRVAKVIDNKWLIWIYRYIDN